MRPRITACRPLPGFCVWLRFTDGSEGEVDLSDLRGKGAFRAWEEPGFFERVFVDSESRTIAWPGELDLDPDVLYSEVTGAPLPGAAQRSSQSDAAA